MAKKTQAAKPEAEKPEGKKQSGTLIRVTDEFANSIRRAAGFEDISIADYANKHLLSVVEDRYRDAVVKEAQRVGKRS